MSIYVINDWSSATTYSIHQIVRHPANSNTFYYSTVNNNLNNTPSTSSTVWGGVTVFNGVVKPHFIWKPSYDVITEHEPDVTLIQFGGGYSQRVDHNVHNDLINLNLIFPLRTEAESEAINHFLHARRGKESFVFTPSPPHNVSKLFICRKWDDAFVFHGNHAIRATFEEVPA